MVSSIKYKSLSLKIKVFLDYYSKDNETLHTPCLLFYIVILSGGTTYVGSKLTKFDAFLSFVCVLGVFLGNLGFWEGKSLPET